MFSSRLYAPTTELWKEGVWKKLEKPAPEYGTTPSGVKFCVPPTVRMYGQPARVPNATKLISGVGTAGKQDIQG